MRLPLLVECLTYMQRTDFHFDLPQELIAQWPTATRSASRMLMLDGADGSRRDLQFRDFPSLLDPADLLVFNDTRVIPARVFALKESGGRVEILLERALTANTALVHLRASKGLKPGAAVRLPGDHCARMLGRQGDLFHLEFSCDVASFFESHGEIPLPPYIDRKAQSADRERYQTVYARIRGAIAAPTAGLHFDADIFAALRRGTYAMPSSPCTSAPAPSSRCGWTMSRSTRCTRSTWRCPRRLAMRSTPRAPPADA